MNFIILFSFITLAINLELLKAKSIRQNTFKMVIPRIEKVLQHKREAALAMANNRKIEKSHTPIRSRRSINNVDIAPTAVKPAKVPKSTKKVLKFKKCNSGLLGKVFGTTYCMHQVSTMIKVSI